MVREGRKRPRNCRDGLDIMAEMLKIARGGTLKTHIMYEAELNSAQLDECLSLLLEIGLLEAVNKGERYAFQNNGDEIMRNPAHEKRLSLAKCPKCGTSISILIRERLDGQLNVDSWEDDVLERARRTYDQCKKLLLVE